MSRSIKILLTILGLLYVASPYDAVPDFIPILGQADDLFVIAALLFYVWRNYFPWLFRRKRPSPAQAGHNGNKQDMGAENQAGPKDPYEILGLERGASHEEIQAAYRQASQRYHPDKVAHLGEEFQELAKQKFVDIQTAYETLRRKGGG